ncbi:MAG: putative DNA-binding domain-containing protein, partial [Woeseiaceae bacterium]
MTERAGFKEKQLAFAAHIRDPDNRAAPAGIEDRRMAIYRELFFNNLYKLIGSTFPVLKKLHSDEQWRALVREFMVRHQSQTPYFLEIPQEFLAFRQEEHAGDDNDFPFLLELAHYEWAELALSVAENADDPASFDPQGDLLRGIPLTSSLAWTLSYRFPVHRISPSFIPTEPANEPVHLAIWRKPDDELGFMELNPLTARLVAMIDANDGHSGEELLLQLGKELGYADTRQFLQHGSAALDDLRRAGIVIGT